MSRSNRRTNKFVRLNLPKERVNTIPLDWGGGGGYSMRKIEYDVARPIALKIQVICTSSTGGEGVAPSKTTSEFVRKQCLLVAFAIYAGGTLVDVWRGGGGGGGSK